MIASSPYVRDFTEAQAECLPPTPGTQFWTKRDFWYAEIAALVARILFLVATAGMFRSIDLYSWQKVVNTLNAGANPYAATTVLNWPPLWMQIVFLLGKVAAITGLPFMLCVQVFLILVDLALIAALYKLLQIVAPEKPAGRVVLWAISLNPVCILLTCQHGNFDGLLALAVVLLLIAVAGYLRSGDPVDWLTACLLLGLAILLKTTPLVLVPLLLVEAGRLRAWTKVLGGVLTIGPVALGMSIIYVLAPSGVSQNVLAYRSIGGYFGITGLLGLADLPLLSLLYSQAFPLLLLVSLIWLTVDIRKFRPISAQFTAVFAAGAMLAIPLFGAGYGPQYLFWSIPLIAAVYHMTRDITAKRMILASYVVAALTYIVEYSLFRSHGALAVQIWPRSPVLTSVFMRISTSGNQTLVRLPLFVALCAVFSRIVREGKGLLSSAS
jgi:hypothetical protein